MKSTLQSVGVCLLALVLLLPLSLYGKTNDVGGLGKYGQSPDVDKDLSVKIEKIIREIHTIKPGTTRADVLKLFAPEGMWFNKWRRYRYRSCPWIKVDVTFDFAGYEKDASREKPTDKVTKISAPFLELAILEE